MQVTEVQILPIKPQNGLIGFASLVVDQQLYLGNIAIYTRADGSGIRLLFPSKTLPNGLVVSCVHPICKQAGQVLTDAVARRMSELASKRDEKPTDPSPSLPARARS